MYLTTETSVLWVTHNKSDSDPIWELVTSYPYQSPRRVDFDSFNDDKMWWVSSFGAGMMYANTTTDIDDIFTKGYNPKFCVYPNPSRSSIQINNENLTGHIVISEIQGRIKLKKKEINNQTIMDIHSLATGIYFVKSISKEGLAIDVEKLVKE